MFIQIPATARAINQRKRVYGVGINDAPYRIAYKTSKGKTLKCPFYEVWRGIIQRCFSEVLHRKRPTYRGCTLDPDWHYFMEFRAWMEQQDWQGKVIDKDLLSYHKKHYGPDTCVFISRELNNLLTLRQNGRGDLPLGVSKTTIKGNTYFAASCSINGKQRKLGYFKTPEEAHACYKQAKLEQISTLAKSESNPVVRQALLNLA